MRAIMMGCIAGVDCYELYDYYLEFVGIQACAMHVSKAINHNYHFFINVNLQIKCVKNMNKT
jgi:hypothetical protein